MTFTAHGFAQKLQNLRESFDNTFDQISIATGIEAEKLLSLEAGKSTPTGDEVLILADFFKQEFSWLIEDEKTNPDENATLLLRSEGGRLAASDRHAIAEFLHLCKSQTLLEEILETRSHTTDFNFTVRGSFYKGHGVDCARAFRKETGLPQNAVVPDIYQWLRKAGFRVFRRALPDSPISGLYIRHPYAGRCILINYTEDIYRQRFSAAHETGHALLDIDKPYNISDSTDFSSRDLVEIRANSFASNFLIPPELLTSLGTTDQWQNPEKIVETADRLSVSIPALLSALVRDKHIDEPTRERLRHAGLRLPNKQDPELTGDFTSRQLERKRSLLANGLHSSYINQGFEAHRRGAISLAKLADIFLVEPRDVGDLAELFGVSLNHG